MRCEAGNRRSRRGQAVPEPLPGRCRAAAHQGGAARQAERSLLALTPRLPGQVLRAERARPVEITADGCMECGTCRVLCEASGEIEWNYPRGVTACCSSSAERGTMGLRRGRRCRAERMAPLQIFQSALFPLASTGREFARKRPHWTATRGVATPPAVGRSLDCGNRTRRMRDICAAPSGPRNGHET